MIDGSRQEAQQDRACEIRVFLRNDLGQARHHGERDGAESEREMRSLAQLVEEPGGEDGNKEGDPKDGPNEVQPLPKRAADDDSPRHHQGQLEPSVKRSLGVGERQQKTGDAADQRRARLTEQNADKDRHPDIDDEQNAASGLDREPCAGRRR